MDGPSYTDRIGSTWLFQFNGSMYIPLGDKLVGAKYLGYSSQGKTSAPIIFLKSCIRDIMTLYTIFPFGQARR